MMFGNCKPALGPIYLPRFSYQTIVPKFPGIKDKQREHYNALNQLAFYSKNNIE